MAKSSKIEWTDHTFNPWIGCTKISCGCDHCYAADMASRYKWAEFAAGAPRHRTSPSYWRQPARWNRQAEANGVREKVFPSLCDPYDAEVDHGWRRDFVRVIRDTPWLDWLLLTKRPHLAGKLWAELDMPPNVWLGTSVENEAMADLRVPQLLAVPARVRFLSIEPMLGPIEIFWAMSQNWLDMAGGFIHRGHFSPGAETLRPIDWVIAGGESGPKARASHPDWIRSVRDQCAAAGVPFFFKQWGEWAPSTPEASAGNPRSGWRMLRGHPHLPRPEELYPENGAAFVARVGKKAAGARLDGIEHRAFPK